MAGRLEENKPSSKEVSDDKEAPHSYSLNINNKDEGNSYICNNDL